jgi:hypothetical protein
VRLSATSDMGTIRVAHPAEQTQRHRGRPAPTTRVLVTDDLSRMYVRITRWKLVVSASQ